MKTNERDNEIRNSITEGRNILRAGSFDGRKLTASELWAVRLSLESASEKLGESRMVGKSVRFTITDATPAGY